MCAFFFVLVRPMKVEGQEVCNILRSHERDELSR